MLIQSALVAVSATLAAAVVPLEVRDNSFVNPTTNKKFQIVGMAYQPGGEAGYKPQDGADPLSDGDKCLRDAAVMQQLGVNVIRSYNLSPDLDHSVCASIFNAAGIYMVLDVNAPGFPNSLNREAPWETYFEGYLERIFGIVENFKAFPNTLAFISANEVIDQPGTATIVPPYLRATTRDLKNYIAKHVDRPIPVGYSAADVRAVLVDTYNFLNCDNGDDNSAGDFFALNSYSWCGDKTTYESSTYAELVDAFKDTAVPVFFSEYGCNDPSPRVLNEVQAIYSPPMSDVMSGGILYEYTQEADRNYGVIQLSNDGSLQYLADYDTLRNQYLKIDFAAVQSQSPPANKGSRPQCSPGLIKEDDFNANFTLPELPPNGQDLIDNGVKPAAIGKIVDVSNFAFPYSIKDADGKAVTGLEVRPLTDDASNIPGTNGNANTGGDDEGAAASLLGPVALWASTLPVIVAFFALT